MAKKNGKKTATPAPSLLTEASNTTEASGAQAAADLNCFPPVKTPTPESHPHLFDIFANPL